MLFNPQVTVHGHTVDSELLERHTCAGQDGDWTKAAASVWLGSPTTQNPGGPQKSQASESPAGT